MKKFIKKHLSLIIIIGSISLQVHFFLLALLHNQRGLINSPIYCNASFTQEFTQNNKEMLSVTLEERLTETTGDSEDGFENESPAGKFKSSFHVGGKHKELIKRLHSSLNLKPKGRGKGGGKGGSKFRRGKKRGYQKKGKHHKGKGGYPQIYEDLLPGDAVKQSYIYRKRQYQDIVVKEVLPTLYTIDKPFKSLLKRAPRDLKKHTDRNKVIEDFRSWLDGVDPKKRNRVEIIKLFDNSKGKAPLHFSRGARKRYFDKTLKEDKELQLKNFVNKYFHYSPNTGDLPMAIRDLYYKNLQRLAYMFSSDITYFMLDYFQENLNKEDFLKHAMAQVAELKNTKAATELLFAVENIYEIQQRAIKLLITFRKRYSNLSKERKNRLRNETLKRVMNRYLPLLKEKKILNEVQSFNIYAKRRIEIMDYLIKQSPSSYRIKDALFTQGSVYWELGKINLDASQYEKAIQIWSKIPTIQSDKGDFLNAEAFNKIWPYLKMAAMRRPEQKGRLSFLPLVNTVSQLLNFRLQKQLSEKRVREDRLLWP